MNQVRLYWLMIFLSVSFLISIWLIIEDWNTRGILILLSVIIGGVTSFVLEIIGAIRKLKVQRLWSKAILLLWVIILPWSAIVIASHDFRILISWVILSGLGIIILAYIGTEIKTAAQKMNNALKNS